MSFSRSCKPLSHCHENSRIVLCSILHVTSRWLDATFGSRAPLYESHAADPQILHVFPRLNIWLTIKHTLIESSWLTSFCTKCFPVFLLLLLQTSFPPFFETPVTFSCDCTSPFRYRFHYWPTFKIGISFLLPSNLDFTRWDMST